MADNKRDPDWHEKFTRLSKERRVKVIARAASMITGMQKKVSNLVLRQHASIADIKATDWNACANSANPFISHAFLSAMESSGSTGSKTGWIPNHLSFLNSGHVEAVIPLYVKLHSYGEYVFDQQWAEAFEKAGGAYYPKLQICSPFSPVTGARILRHPSGTISLSEISTALTDLAIKRDMSSVHVTFCTQEEGAELGAAGWLQRTGIQFHWYNQGYQTFEDFLGSLTSSHRKSIRRERRDANAAGLVFKTLRGDDIKAWHWDLFYQFYQSTVDRKWGVAYLTREFFDQLEHNLGDTVILMMAFYNDVPIAGALNLLGNTTLYGRNWGCKGEWPFLHFELCYYRAIDFAIENKIKRVEAGAQGSHKIQRGYVPQRTYSNHFIAHPGLSQAVGRFLEQEREMIELEIKNLGEYSPYRKII